MSDLNPNPIEFHLLATSRHKPNDETFAFALKAEEGNALFEVLDNRAESMPLYSRSRKELNGINSLYEVLTAKEGEAVSCVLTREDYYEILTLMSEYLAIKATSMAMTIRSHVVSNKQPPSYGAMREYKEAAGNVSRMMKLSETTGVVCITTITN